MTPIRLPFDNSFARQLPFAYESVTPASAPAPRLLAYNTRLATELGLPTSPDEMLARMWSGNALPTGATPIAQVYAGHQFGGFSPRLGDGRALLVGELADATGQRRDLALKGSGRTIYSRGGDGKAAIGPMLREYIIGEALHGLGIPTTRALAVVATGEHIMRETPLPGAVLTRVAASHLRVGTFQYFAARREYHELAQLVAYAIARHEPALLTQTSDGPPRVVEFIRGVAKRQARLIAQWMHVGFVHGVMNTDNMTISGESIDFGPCAFIDGYDLEAVFSSIDHQGRYAFGNQPKVAQWNVARLAEALLPLLGSDEASAVKTITPVIEEFTELYEKAWLDIGLRKLGVVGKNLSDDRALLVDWLGLLGANKVDHTLAYRYLADAAEGYDMLVASLFLNPLPLHDWLCRWRRRLVEDGRVGGEVAASMRAQNPLYLARNHLVDAALTAASERGDVAPTEHLVRLLRAPFTEQAEGAFALAPAPAGFSERFQTFCGT